MHLDGADTDSALLGRLRARGWRLSAQRRAVAEALGGRHVHLTADEVHARALAILPEVSRATVYNTLNELVALGEIGMVTGNGPNRYDPNVDRVHQHLMCLSCDALLDVVPTGQGHLRLPADQSHGYRLVDTEIVFRGICPTCAAAPAAPP
ncbi:MAG: Fur family transcriptional regulator, partial [Actinomycetes bacterium]